MKTAFTISFLILLSSSNSFAKQTRKPNQTVPAAISIQVNYGDRITHFVVSQSHNKNVLTIKNNENLNSSKPISNEDLKFLKTQISKLPKESNDPQFCLRSFIQVESGPEKRFACIGGKNQLAKDLLDLVNLLTLQF